MGIDFHTFNFLRYASNFGNFSKTTTIGRQRVFVNERNIKNAFHSMEENYKQRPPCEDLLKRHFGASVVDSIDNSDYEQATIIHDMNNPLPRNLYSSCDTILDGGCLEHIYNAPQALKNCSLLCRPHGQIIHVLPANNCCGHGFWQFSPELFFSLYSERNGYVNTEVFLADLTNKKNWYRVTPPKDGCRVDVHSSTEIYVLVRTVLKGSAFSHDNVQQSDYIYHWTQGSSPSATNNVGRKSIRRAAEESDFLYQLIAPPYQFFQKIKNTLLLSTAILRNPGLQKVEISTLIRNNAISAGTDRQNTTITNEPASRARP